MKTDNLNIENRFGILKNCLSEFKLLSGNNSSHNLKNKAEELLYKINNNSINLAIIGQYKRGKSSLINSILGENILPTSVLPLTSVITVVRYNENKTAFVYFQDDKDRQIELNEIEDYISEIANPNNIKGVKYVEIGYPNPFLNKGNAFIDTPGIGSLHNQNTLTAYEYLPEIDAALFVTSPDPVLTETEINYLKEVKKNTGKIVFILNKKDLLTEPELNKVLDYIKVKISEFVGLNNIEFFAVSSKDYLDAKMITGSHQKDLSGIPELEKYIENFIKTEKLNLLIDSSKRKFLTLVNREQNQLDLRTKMHTMDIDSLNSCETLMTSTLKSITAESEQVFGNLKTDLKTISLNFQKTVSSMKTELTNKIKTELLNLAEKGMDSSRNSFRAMVDKKYSSMIAEGVEDIRNAITEQMEKQISKLAGKYNATFNELIGSIYDAASKFLKINLNKMEIEYDFKPPEKFEYITTEFKLMLETDKNFVSFLLPKKIYINKIINRYFNRIEFNLNYNLSHITDSADRNLDNFLRDYASGIKTEAEKTTESIIEIINSVKLLKKGRESEYNKEFSELREKSEKLSEIRESLINI